MSHVTFDAPDLTLFCRLDALGLEAVGQRVKPGRAVIECRVVDSDEWCRRCGCQGAARDTVFDRPGTSNGPTEAIFECGAGWSGWQWSWRLGCDSRSNWPVSAVSSNAPQSDVSPLLGHANRANGTLRICWRPRPARVSVDTHDRRGSGLDAFIGWPVPQELSAAGDVVDYHVLPGTFPAFLNRPHDQSFTEGVRLIVDWARQAESKNA